MKTRARHEESLLTQSRHRTVADAQVEQIEASEKKKPRTALILFALSVVIGLGALFVGVNSRSPNSSGNIDLTNVEQRRKLEASVNRHIQLTNRKIEIEKERIKVDAAFAIPRVGHIVPGKKKDVFETRLDLRADRREYNPARDLDRRGETSQPINAADVVHQDMADAELYRHAEEAYRQEQARQYVEQARRNGYEIQLDNEYRIKSVKQLPREAAGEAYR